MKISKQLVVSFLMLIGIASLYRVMPGALWFCTTNSNCILEGVIMEKNCILLPPCNVCSDALYQLPIPMELHDTESGGVHQLSIIGGLTVFGYDYDLI